MTRHALLDTSFLIALENRGDPHHQRAKELDRELIAQNAMLVLHGGILLEIGDGYARLGRRSKANDLFQRLLNEDRYRIEPLTQRLLDDGMELYLARSDKEWGLTDCVSFAMMRADGISEALTADVHFRQAGFEALLLSN
ncbi:MAG: PIN domain-containing protein [Planctomycetota bacterium]|nr:PIN domain-containing protein [Planctomycetota bacterium]